MTEEKQPSAIPFNPDAESNAMEEISLSSASKNNNNNSDAEELSTCCPLFMTGLPMDFSTNPQLAALASLLNDDDSDDDDDDKDGVGGNKKSDQDKRLDGGGGGAGRFKRDIMPTPRSGGKVRMEKSRSIRRSQGAPYAKPTPALKEETKKKKEKASLGEAQLFLNMWKL
jgi:hypothetical protein